MTFQKIHIDERPSHRDLIVKAETSRGRFIGLVDLCSYEYRDTIKQVARNASEEVARKVDVWLPVPRWMKFWEVTP